MTKARKASGLPPFWRYYGGKNRSSRKYPPPENGVIVEPFAGAAGYACRHYQYKVVLLDKSPIITGLWRYLIRTSAAEILSLPDVPEGGTVDDVPVCQEARWLMGFWCNSGNVNPAKRPSARARNDGQKASNWSGWGYKSRDRVARHVDQIRHWEVLEGGYQDSPDITATWFIDPPYNNKAGRLYPYQPDDFEELGRWCQTRRGLTIVCENEGADWLPFSYFGSFKSQEGTRGKGKSREAIWVNRTEASP